MKNDITTQDAAQQGEASPALKALLAHQAAIQVATDHAARVERVIAEHVAKQQSLDGKDQEYAAAMLLSQDVAAAVALGEKDQSELDAAMAQCTRIEAELDQLVDEKVDSAVLGLPRKLEQAKAALKKLQEGRPALARAVLMERADALGAAYAQAALTLVDHAKRIGALNRLLLAQGQTMPISLRGRLQIPTCGLEAVMACASFHEKDFIIRQEVLGHETKGIEAEEMRRFEGMGVDLSAPQD